MYVRILYSYDIKKIIKFEYGLWVADSLHATKGVNTQSVRIGKVVASHAEVAWSIPGWADLGWVYWLWWNSVVTISGYGTLGLPFYMRYLWYCYGYHFILIYFRLATI